MRVWLRSRWCMLARPMLGVAALCLLSAPEVGAASRSAYSRLAIGPGCAVYGLIRRGELFLSDTVDGLASAAPIKPTNVASAPPELGEAWSAYTYPEVALPVPADKLSMGLTQVKASLNYNTGVVVDPAQGRRDFSFLHGRLAFCRKDEQGTSWSYCLSVTGETARRPEQAAAIVVPQMGPLTLKVVTKPLKVKTEQGEEDRMGIGLRLMAGEAALEEVVKEGTAAPVHLRVVSSEGKEVCSEAGDLAKFGFT
jgi:hypothetical protein